MPKGHNKDGSKKVRPANSGRKAKEHKQISPQISLEAVAVLKGLKKQKININDFISQAILEKAERKASQGATLEVKSQPTIKIGQVDLVEMLQDIKKERFLDY